MTKKAPRTIAVLDSETDPFKFGRVPSPFIWGFYDGKTFLYWETTAEMLEYVRDKPMTVYAHNGGRFDWHFIKEFIELGTDVMIINGRIAKFKIGACEFRDSINLIPVKLATYDKDEIDYRLMEAHRRRRPDTWEKIITYLRKDCVSLYELVTGFVELYGKHMTQASASMHAWRDMTKLEPPRSDEAFYNAIKPWYRGGRVEARCTGITDKLFSLYDINSAYPYAMLSEHPFGVTPIEHTRMRRIPSDANRYFFEIDAISRGALPTEIADAKSMEKTQYPTDNVCRRYFSTGWEIMAGLETGTLDIKKIHRAVSFDHYLSFGDYILYFYELRRQAKKDGDKLLDIFSKLLMNSLYGKFAADPSHYRRYQLVAEDRVAELLDGDVARGRIIAYDGASEEPWRYTGTFSPGVGLAERKLSDRERRYYNVATGASITGYVRAHLWRAICAAGPENVIYCDTDSIAAIGTAHDLKLSDKLGDWKPEGLFDRAVIVRKKLYAFRREEADYKKMRAESSSVERWKKAHKGVSNVTPSEMMRLARGERLTFRSEVPSYTVNAGVVFRPRTLSK